MVERANRFADEKRIPRGGPPHGAGLRGLAACVREDRRYVALAQRAELEAGDVRPPRQTGHDVGEQGRATGLGVAVGGQHEHARGGVGAQQVAQQQQRQVVGPVQVVEHQQHGHRLAGGLQQRGGGLERAQPLDLRLCGSRLGDAAGQAGRELGQQLDQVACTRAQLDAQLVDRARGDVGAKRLCERLCSRGQAVVAAAIEHHALARACVRGDLGRQARLADARLAADQDAAAAPGDRVGPRRVQLGELLLAARERGAAFELER